MRVLDPKLTVRAAPVVGTCLLFLGLFLALQPTQFAAGSVAPALPAAVHHSHAGTDAGASGGGLTQTGVYPAAAAEEAETEDRLPAKAWFLTALLFAIFPGAILGLLVGGRMCKRKAASVLIGRRVTSPIFLLPPRELAPSRLSVFLL
jgi:hypothetical protein